MNLPGLTTPNPLPTIFPSIDAAHDALPACPRPLHGSGGYHWWYIDSEAMDAQFEAEERGETVNHDIVPCLCKTCPQKMLLSADAEEYPAV